MAFFIAAGTVSKTVPVTVMAEEILGQNVFDGGPLNQQGALGAGDIPFIKIGTKYARPKDIVYTTFQTEYATKVQFVLRYLTADGSWAYENCYASQADNCEVQTGVWTIKTVIPSNAASGTGKLFKIITTDENAKSVWPVTNIDIQHQDYTVTTSLGAGDFMIVDVSQASVVFDASYLVLPHYDITKDGGKIVKDEHGHELFSTFKYCQKVGYTCYFGSDGYLYRDQIAFDGDKVYYLNGNGTKRLVPVCKWHGLWIYKQ